MVKSIKETFNKLNTATPQFSQMMGLRVTKKTKNQVEAELFVTEMFTNRNGVMHGGAIMAFADDVGGTTTFMNLREGLSTTTIESKTNFLRPINIGDKITAVCKVLNLGKKIVVLQTQIYRSDRKIAAIVTQTQMILKFKK